ncbi:Atu1372/SO_1960 family protein [Georgenia sp. SUBG003]|uniref:Atu1372/SO_1960 family protein n=1 Tax=Georgenia sp. SUBG003 TaxID=1497974 RepID=UPI003AB64BD7
MTRIGDIWVEHHGEGPAVLLLGGLGDTVESWQLQLDALADRFTGKVGDTAGAVTPEQAKDAARTCALNALAAVAAEAGGLDHVVRVVKVTGFVASEPAFTGQPGVVNGASEILGEIFGDAGRHARSAVGVAALPLDAPVEVEIVVAVR